MLFRVTLPPMNESETTLNMLDTLLNRVEDEVHELELEGSDMVEETSWYQSCRSDRRKLLEKCAEASLHRSPKTRGPHLRRIEVTDGNSARDARNIAFTPLTVLVENRLSDGALVKVALRVFASQQTWDLCFGSGAGCTPAAFELDSGGGQGEVGKLLDVRLSEANRRGLPPRLVVVVDSDGQWVGDVKKDITAIRNTCAASNVPCPPLNKRTAENYIPDAFWSRLASDLDHTVARPAIEALLRLSRDQRDYVNMGPGVPWDVSNANSSALFSGVSDTDQTTLSKANLKGGGSSMMRKFADPAAALTPEDFETRDPGGDLEALARCIEDEL